ncbi:MAG TPA: GAF domain-containing protein, partial [Roseiarcus sp.]|nr:GAF domain-containing protein [Roseiarcus sp.]
TITAATPVERLDLATMIKLSQAVSGEMALERLVDTLMRLAIEQAGAERGVLLLPRKDELRIEAEAATSADAVVVRLSDQPTTATPLPESVIHYVVRSCEVVILDDAAAQPLSADDPYVRDRKADRRRRGQRPGGAALAGPSDPRSRRGQAGARAHRPGKALGPARWSTAFAA